MKILVAVDGSKASDAALEIVRSRPWPANSQIRVLSIAEPTYALPLPMGDVITGHHPYPGSSVLNMQEQQLDHAAQMAHRAADLLRTTGCRTDGLADAGDPRDAIVTHAKEWHADLIVLGSHGRTGLKRWLLGSVAESVVRHAPCSVEVARLASN